MKSEESKVETCQGMLCRWRLRLWTLDSPDFADSSLRGRDVEPGGNSGGME